MQVGSGTIPGVQSRGAGAPMPRVSNTYTLERKSPMVGSDASADVRVGGVPPQARAGDVGVDGTSSASSARESPITVCDASLES